MLFTVEFQLLSKKFPLPAGQVTLTEEQLDQYTREYLQILVNKKVRYVSPGGGTSYKWANGDVPLDGVAFSRLD